MRVALLSIEASSCLLASSTLREEGRPMSGRSFSWSRDALSTACGCPGSLKKFRIQLSDSCLTRCLHPVIPATIMKLRDHPLLSRYGVKSWPPTWTWIEGRADKKPKGGVGILKEVKVSKTANRCFLVILQRTVNIHRDTVYK